MARYKMLFSVEIEAEANLDFANLSAELEAKVKEELVYSLEHRTYTPIEQFDSEKYLKPQVKYEFQGTLVTSLTKPALLRRFKDLVEMDDDICELDWDREYTGAIGHL